MAVLLWPYLPASTERLLAALGARGRARSPGAELGRGRDRSACSALEPLFPKDAAGAAARRDRLAHPPRPLRAARRRARRGRRGGGRQRACSPSASTAPPAAPRSPPPRTSRRSTRRSGATRTRRAGFDDADLAELRALAAHERCVAIGETGPRLLPRRRAAARDQERAFAAQIALARETGKPLVIHTRAADERDARAARAPKPTGVSVVMHCFSMPERLRRVPGPRLRDLVRRQRHLHERRASSPRRRARCPRSSLLVETDAPYLTPAGRAQRAQPAGVRRAHAGVPRRAARRRAAGARRRRRAQRGARVRLGDERRGRRAGAQPSLRRMRRFGVRPDRDLGQNFLIDSNILGVIDRAAELDGRGRRARDRRRPRACSPSTSPSASRTCTWSRSTSACARRCSTPTGAARQRRPCTGATR